MPRKASTSSRNTPRQPKTVGTIPLFKGILIQNFRCSSIAFFRVATAFIAISLFVLVNYLINGKQGRFLMQKKHLWSFIGYGAICIAATNYFYLESLTRTSTAIAVITVFVTAPITTLIVAILTGDKKDKREVICILSIVVGCILVNMQTTASETHWDGIGCAALAGICYGLFGIFGKNIAKDYDYPVMMFWQFLIATIATLAATALLGENILTTLLSISSAETKNIWAIIGIGTVSTFIPYLLYSYGLKKGVPPTTASALTLFEPISGTILAFFFLNERLTPSQIFGILVVIFFSILLSTSKKNCDPPSKDALTSQALQKDNA